MLDAGAVLVPGGGHHRRISRRILTGEWRDDRDDQKKRGE
jgi:hypothetical protein